MKNKEKYAKEIIEIACGGSSIAVDRQTGEVRSCCTISCGECLFGNDATRCPKKTKEWAESEYIEKPVISKRDRAFLEFLNDKCKYIARDRDDGLYGYESTAAKYKGNGIWYTLTRHSNISYFFTVDFPMVKWSDSEPWLIDDLKKLEVVDSYE